MHFLEQLEKCPIVTQACQKLKIGKSTYYDWRKNDADFASLADESMAQGVLQINDLAEAGLMQLIREKKLGAIIFWLKHHHQDYRAKVSLHAFFQEKELSHEQQSTVLRALKMADGELEAVTVSQEREKKEISETHTRDREKKL